MTEKVHAEIEFLYEGELDEDELNEELFEHLTENYQDDIPELPDILVLKMDPGDSVRTKVVKA